MATRFFLGITAALLVGAAQSSALTITPIFDSSIVNDPRGSTIAATIYSAIAAYEFYFSDPVTVLIEFHEMSDGLGASSTTSYGYSYSSYRNVLNARATSDDDEVAFANLPTASTNPVTGDANVWVKRALARVLAFTVPAANDPSSPRAIVTSVLLPASEAGENADALRRLVASREGSHVLALSSVEVDTASTLEGSIGLKTSITNLSPSENDPTKYSLYAVVCHEIDEVLGTSSTLNGLKNTDPTPTSGAVEVEDLFRYDNSGNRSFSTNILTQAYFSLDGQTLLARFNQKEGGDFGDWYSPGGQIPQVQDAFATPGATPLPAAELRVLDALGYNRVPAQVWVDVTYNGSVKSGTYRQPDNTIAAGRDRALTNGTLKLKGPRSTAEKPTINKALTLSAVGGAVTIGR